MIAQVRWGPFWMGLTHEEKRQRRKDIADFIKKGGDPFDAAREFRVSMATVKLSCLEFKTPFSVSTGRESSKRPGAGRKVSDREKLMRIVAGLIEGTPSVQIAESEDVSKQYVSEIKSLAKQTGILDSTEKLREKVKQLEGELRDALREKESAESAASTRDDSRKEKLIELVAAGKTIEDAAAESGYNLLWAYRIVNQMGIEQKRPGRITDARKMKILKDLRDGKTPTEAARRAKVSVKLAISIRDAARGAGVL